MAKIDWPRLTIGERIDRRIHLDPDFFSDLENYNNGGSMRVNPGDIIQYEEPVRIFHRYLVLKIVKEDEESIMCDCLAYTGNGYTTVPYIVWKHDSYQYTTVIEHADISKLDLLKEG